MARPAGRPAPTATSSFVMKRPLLLRARQIVAGVRNPVSGHFGTFVLSLDWNVLVAAASIHCKVWGPSVSAEGTKIEAPQEARG